MTRHTHMSDEAITATIDAMQAQPGHTYPIELSYTDFSNLMWALQKIWHDGHGAHRDTCTDLANWAGTRARSIAATLGVQMV